MHQSAAITSDAKRYIVAYPVLTGWHNNTATKKFSPMPSKPMRARPTRHRAGSSLRGAAGAREVY